MEVTERREFAPVEIVLTTQEEIDQLFAILNYSPVAKALKLGECNWLKLRTVLGNHQRDSLSWHNRLLKELG